MKKTIIIILAALICSVFINKQAYALNRLGVSRVVSGNYELEEQTKKYFKTKKPDGVGFSWVLNSGVMFRLESITTELEYYYAPLASLNLKISLQTSIISFGYRHDFTDNQFHIAGTYGSGSTRVLRQKGEEEEEVVIPGERKTQRQIYLEAGYNITPAWDIYIGHHRITDLTATSVGFNYGF